MWFLGIFFELSIFSQRYERFSLSHRESSVYIIPCHPVVQCVHILSSAGLTELYLRNYWHSLMATKLTFMSTSWDTCRVGQTVVSYGWTSVRTTLVVDSWNALTRTCSRRGTRVNKASGKPGEVDRLQSWRQDQLWTNNICIFAIL